MSEPGDPTPSEVAEWLRDIGLGDYAGEFERNHIGGSTLATLTDDDLKELGMVSLGPRKMLLAEIRKLVEQATAQNPPPPSPKAPVPRVPAAQAPAAEAPVAPAPPKLPTEQSAPAARDPAASSFDPPRKVVELPPQPERAASAPAPAATSAAVAAPETAAHNSSPATKRTGFWAKLLVRKFLLVSIVLHLLFGLGTTYFIVQKVQAKRKVTFQGGPPAVNASKRALEHKVSMAQKKKTGGAPPQPKRIVSAGLAKVSLPDLPSVPTSSAVPGMAVGMGGAGFGTGMGFGNGAGGGMGGGGGGGGGLTMFGVRGAGTGLVGTLYDLKQKRNKRPSGVNAGNYHSIVRKWAEGGMKESEIDDYYKAPGRMSASQFMIPDMDANEAPKAYSVEKLVKPGQWLAVYRGKVQPPKEGTYHFIGAADDLLLVRVNGKLVLDASWVPTSSLQPKEIIPAQYGSFPRGGYIRGEGVQFSGTSWSEIEVIIGECPGGHFWGVLMVQQSGSGSGGKIPLFRLADVKFPKSDGPPFPNCDLKGPIWRVQAASGGSLLDSLRR